MDMERFRQAFILSTKRKGRYVRLRYGVMHDVDPSHCDQSCPIMAGKSRSFYATVHTPCLAWTDGLGKKKTRVDTFAVKLYLP